MSSTDIKREMSTISMLGYETADLDMMIAHVNIAAKQLGNSGIARGLEEVSSFLQGLWAEGYFD